MRKIWRLALVALAAAAIPATGAKAAKVEKTTFKGHQYAVINEGLTWNEANKACIALGGHLVTINSKAENEFVKSLIADDGPGRKNYWLGGHKDSKGAFKWITGEKFKFASWAPGQPDRGYETALMMYTYNNPNAGGDESYLWNDLVEEGTFGRESWFGLDNFGYVCEWDGKVSLYGDNNHFHTYKRPDFKWSGEKCYAIFKCNCGEKLKLACKMNEKVLKQATMKKEGKVRIMPTIQYGSSTYGTSYKYFKIKKIKSVSLTGSEFAYTGEKQVPVVVVKDASGKTIDKANYELTYYSKDNGSISGSIEPGAYYVKITFKKRYSGSVSLDYTIVKAQEEPQEEPQEDPVMANINHLCELWSGKYFTTTGEAGKGNGDDITKNTAVASSAYFEGIMGFKFAGEQDAAAKFPYHYINDSGSIYPTAWTCAGFAAFAQWYIYTGGDTSAKVNSGLVARNVDNNYASVVGVIKTGDIIRYGKSGNKSMHSAIVISLDENNGIYVLDANYLRTTAKSETKDYNLVGAHYIPFYNKEDASTYYQLTVTGVR